MDGRVSAASRRKGLSGEHEVAAIWQTAGFAVRGLEGTGDHLVIRCDGLTIHSEVKRRERINVWECWAQAERETPQGALTVLAIRRNRGKWLAVVELEDLVPLLADAEPPPQRMTEAERRLQWVRSQWKPPRVRANVPSGEAP